MAGNESIDVTRRIQEIGRDVASIPFNLLPDVERAVFIALNTFRGFKLNTGSTVHGDAWLFSKAAKRRGYTILFVQNPPKMTFLDYMFAVLQRTKIHLIVAVVGRGDDIWQFCDGAVRSDELEACIGGKQPDAALTIAVPVPFSLWASVAAGGKVRSLSKGASDETVVTAEQALRAEKGDFFEKLAFHLRTNPTATLREIEVALDNVSAQGSDPNEPLLL